MSSSQLIIKNHFAKRESRSDHEFLPFAFAALKNDGSVVTWGRKSGGGDSSSVKDKLSSDVTQVFCGQSGFAALKNDGSVVTWGATDSSNVDSALTNGVTKISSTPLAFAALKEDGSVVSWGDLPWIEIGFNEVSKYLQSKVVDIFS